MSKMKSGESSRLWCFRSAIGSSLSARHGRLQTLKSPRSASTRYYSQRHRSTLLEFLLMSSKKHQLPCLLLAKIVVQTIVPNQPMEKTVSESDDKGLVAQILSSYLSNNIVAPADLPSVIESVKKAFSSSAEAVSPPATEGESKTWEPAVSVKKSISPEAITCLICGGKFKSLKRHLQ